MLYYRAIKKEDLLKCVSMLSYCTQKYKHPNGDEERYATPDDVLEQIATARKKMKDLDDFKERWGGRRSQVLESGGIIFFLTGLLLAGFYITSLVFNIDETYLIRSIIDLLRQLSATIQK